MSHAIHRVTRFTIAGPHTLDVGFEDGTAQRINFRPVLHGSVFGSLQDLTTFNAVVLDAEAGTLIWPNGADFDPATLHDWPNISEELAARAREWANVATANPSHAGEAMEPSRR